jgi:hypothetical protein
MKAQGYGVKDNVLFQDNKSSIFWRRMGNIRAASAQITLTSGISLLPTVLKRRKYQWYGALQGT